MTPRRRRPIRTLAILLATLGATAFAGQAAAAAGPPRPVAAFCLGAEGHDTAISRRPSVIVLECESYGPQYGNPNVEFLDRLSWLTWGRTSARGYGMLTYGPPQVCPPDGSGCTGGRLATVVAQVRLSEPVPFGPAGRTRFTRVTVTVSGLPDTGFGRQVLTYTPPKRAYR